MRIAFVGIEKDWNDLYNRNYTRNFIKYHLELPWYYALHGNHGVFLVTSDNTYDVSFSNTSYLMNVTHEDFINSTHEFDVVVHWRKWFPQFYKKEALNVINSQDHSYSKEWLQNVENATREKQLDGILCFPHWHKNNLSVELNQLTHKPSLLPGVTLGVDTQVYMPAKNKHHRTLLWASDPGRGIDGAYELIFKLFQIDKRYKLNVCWPDYVANRWPKINHPAIEYHDNLDNGRELWDLFNTAGFLPYTSTFKEPSSRAHRQAMAAGCVVLYPPNMGTPSDLLTNNVDGIVSPVNEWVSTIDKLANNLEEYNKISKAARDHAISENWSIQAARFTELFRVLKEIKNG